MVHGLECFPFAGGERKIQQLVDERHMFAEQVTELLLFRRHRQLRKDLLFDLIDSLEKFFSFNSVVTTARSGHNYRTPAFDAARFLCVRTNL